MDRTDGVATDEEQEVRLEPFETPNPWLKRVFSLPAYGRVPAGALKAMREFSPDPEERVVGAIRVRAGRIKWGYLVATTHWLRYLQTVPTRADDFWPYSYAIHVPASGVIESPAGETFLVRWGKAKNFRNLHAAMQQAIAWEADHPSAEVPAGDAPMEAPQPTSAASSLSAEIERLAALQQRGILTPEEFVAAKAHLLGM